MSGTMDSMATDVDQQELAQQLLAQAKEQGIDLVGPDGLLNRLTKNVLETALEAEIDEHLGYEKHDVSGRGSGNSRNGTRTKTVLTEIGQWRSMCHGTPVRPSIRRSSRSASAD
jgi:hypothetical protein